ncbi:hypothetical protein [Stenotrophomonas bentonitica]|uniref:hypothetical protein n=1 Tax=Stenotrophomonas bentonitica TaxID=1450134 RepID=UPI00345E8D76
MNQRIPWSLGCRVRRDKHAWQRVNKEGARHAYTWLERQLLHGSEHPLRFLLSLLVMWAALGLFLSTAAGDLPWSKSVANEVDYFAVLWTVQATLAALVYPIVISFVAVFLQKRPLAQALIKLYLLDSSALAAGISSLGLVMVMAAQYLLLPMTGAAVWRSFVVVDALWFLINAVITTRFLLRTVAFLRPESQLDVVMRYVANVALPRRIETLHLHNVLLGAQERGWLPPREEELTLRREEPAIYVYPSTFDEKATRYRVKFTGAREVADVRMWPLALALKWWMYEARKQSKELKSPALTFLPVPGNVYEGGIDILAISGRPQVNKVQEWLVRLSVKLKKTNFVRYDASIGSIFDEFEADALAGLRAEDTQRFVASLGALTQLHEMLLRLSNFRQDEGRVESWVQLSESNIFSFDLHRQWLQSYRALFEQAVRMISHDRAPFRRLVRVFQKLHSDEVAMSPPKVREDLAKLPVLLMRILGEWWIDRIEEEGVFKHDYQSSTVLSVPMNRWYEECVIAFASAWEEGRSYTSPLPSSNTMVWSKAEGVGHLHQVHVRETASLLLSAVSRGDKTAAEWLADVLGKWWGNLDYEHPPMSIYNKTSTVTVRLLGETWPKVAELLGLSDGEKIWRGDSEQSLQRGVLLAALHNYWSDIRLLTVELLLAWIMQTAPARVRDSLAFGIVVGLLGGRDWKGGGTISEALSQLKPQDYLWAKIREYFVDDCNSGYAADLDSFVEGVRESNVGTMVSSRQYIRHGAEDMSALRDSVVAMLVVLSNADWSPNEHTYGRLDEWVIEGHARIERVNRLLGEWIEVIDQEKPQQCRAIAILLHVLNRSSAVDVRAARVRRVLVELQARIATNHASAVRTAKVSPARLLQIAQYAQVSAFDARDGGFPLQLFDGVRDVDCELEDSQFTIRVRKGELTDVELEARAINEAQYWGALVTDFVGAVLMNDVLQRAGVREVVADDAHAYWDQFKLGVATYVGLGMSPVLILDNQTRPDWVWDWMHPGDDDRRPADFRFRRREGQGEAYVGHFNDVPVYAGRIKPGRSLLLPLECFGNVKFKVDAQGSRLRVDVVREDESGQLADVRLSFSRAVEGAVVEAVSLMYETPLDRAN